MKEPPNRELIDKAIRASIADTLDMPMSDIRSDVDIGEYGADSLVVALIAGDMEKKFGIPVPDSDDINGLSTINDLTTSFLGTALKVNTP